MIVRKFKSLIKQLFRKFTSLRLRAKCYLFGDGITFGKNISLGKNVVIKTTDGGRILIGDDVSIEANSYIYAQEGEITIGSHTFIGSGTHIVARESIKVGDHCLIAAYTVIRDADHGIKLGLLINSQPHTVSPISIGNDVWTGSHSVITKGCTIGDGAVVGANAVVTKNVESMSIVGGVPAKFIKNRIN